MKMVSQRKVKEMKKRVIALLLAVLALLGSLSGCQEKVPQSKDIELVVILGKHANMMFPSARTLKESKLPALLGSAVEYGKSNGNRYGKMNVRFIVCDGNPEEVLLKDENGAELDLTVEHKNYDNVERDLVVLQEKVFEAMQSEMIMADDSESDLISALGQAKDMLEKSDCQNKMIVVIDNGISTDGYLEMQHFSIQNRTADKIVSDLAPDAKLDLSGMAVYFIGLGNVDGEDQQQIVGQKMKDELVSFWETYLRDWCGAELPYGISFSGDTLGTPLRHVPGDSSGYPAVTSVAFEDTQTYIPPEPDDTGKVDKPVEEILEFNDVRLQFKPKNDNDEMAEFLNKNQAVTTIKNYKGYFEHVLAYDPNAIFYVVGSIAQTTPDHTKEGGTTSLERAFLVAEVMVEELGVPAKNIRLIQGGLTDLSWCCAEEFPNGKDTPEDITAAAQKENRVVAIIPSIFDDNMNELDTISVETGKKLIDMAVAYSGDMFDYKR